MTPKRMLLTIVLLFAAGCATAPKKDMNIVWPDPPDEPRIIFLSEFLGEDDYRSGISRFFDVLFGVPKQGLAKPTNVYAKAGKIYLTQAQSPAVKIIDPRERKVATIGVSGKVVLRVPTGVVVSASGIIYVTDSALQRVFAFDENGASKLAFGNKDLVRPVGLALNHELQRLYVADGGDHAIKVYNMKGEKLFQFGKRGGGDGEFNYPTFLAVDRRTGRVLVTDTANYRIQIFDKDGTYISKFGQVGTSPGSFARPKGVSVDSEGHIYVTDGAFNNFQILDDTGQALLSVGMGGNAPGYFVLPLGLYIDEEDRIYVADQYNNRIQAFQYVSEKWKKDNPEKYNKLVTEGL